MCSRKLLKRALKAGGLLLIFLIFLPGCGIHFYNKADDDLAKKAQTAFTDSKLSESLVAERARLKELLEKELQAVRRETSNRRNLHLLNIISYTKEDSWKYLKDKIDEGFIRLYGDVATADEQAKELVKLLEAIELQEGNMASAFELYSMKKEKSDPPLKCPMKNEDNTRINNPYAIIDYENFKESCQEYTELYKKLPSKGLIGEITREIEELNAERSKFSASVKVAKEKYEQALQALKDAQSKGNNSKIEDAAKELKQLLDEIEKPLSEPNMKTFDAVLSKMHLDDLRLAGLAEKIKLQKDNIDEILNAIAKDNGNSTVAPGAETKLYIKLAGFLPEFEKIIDSSLSYPQVHYLLLESENLRLRLEAVNRRLERAEGLLSLMKLKVKAILTESKYLYKSKKWFSEMDKKINGKAKCPKQTLFTEDFYMFKSGSECRQFMAQSLVDYANSWSLGRQPQEEIDYMIIGLRHEAALDSSEIALAQWQNLIGVPLAELVDYHGKGITSADLTNLINALGLGSIAVGVNK